MNLKMIRKTFTDLSTIGDLFIDGARFCYTLEDKDRGLLSTMPLFMLQNMKIMGATAIPYGTYRVAITDSARFKCPMPEIMNVPQFDGIRIHSGNTDKDTAGCVLLGKIADHDFIGQSKIAFGEFFPLIEAALANNGTCTIEIVKEEL